MSQRTELSVFWACVLGAAGMVCVGIYGLCGLAGLDDKSAAEKHCDAIGWTYLHDAKYKGYCASPEFVVPE